MLFSCCLTKIPYTRHLSKWGKETTLIIQPSGPDLLCSPFPLYGISSLARIFPFSSHLFALVFLICRLIKVIVPWFVQCLEQLELS